jgi:2-polyprenyl-3-methyl-5-hydroxy-6-metoxy-1,4-benzoquinol methylase
MNQTPANNIYNVDVCEILKLKKYKKIVEVGCMHGALAKEYKKFNPEVEWYGIDIDMGYAEIAAAHCTKTFCRDIERLTMVEKYFFSDSDIWIFADVLEHLYNPWKLLSEISSLNKKTEIIACIPNSQHWSFQARINAGQMQYDNEGLFDKTHIRFFSLNTMTHMFLNNGFEIISVIPRVFDFKDQNKYDDVIYKMAELSGSSPLEAVANSKIYQYVFHLKSIF